MTDLELSKALALAIGWPESDIDASDSAVHVCFEVATLEYPATWRLFDYKSPDIIWPIAERHNCWPTKLGQGYWVTWWKTTSNPSSGSQTFTADTAAKVVALAVIGNHATK